MSFKANVPLFNESVDPTEPSSAVLKFAGMAVGAGLALAALMAGNELLETTSNATGVGDSDDVGIPVAGR